VFRSAFLRTRCLITASGYYEWAVFLDQKPAGFEHLRTNRLAARARRRLSAKEPGWSDASMRRVHAGPDRLALRNRRMREIVVACLATAMLDCPLPGRAPHPAPYHPARGPDGLHVVDGWVVCATPSTNPNALLFALFQCAQSRRFALSRLPIRPGPRRAKGVASPSGYSTGPLAECGLASP
jgi:hypothetical protein